jgi:hypothetical protein
MPEVQKARQNERMWFCGFASTKTNLGIAGQSI